MTDVATGKPVNARLIVAGLISLTMVTGVIGALGAPMVPAIAEEEGCLSPLPSGASR
ncbi:hypothetical protein [Nocardioides alcanivorans]|uniref:hypothetical protein n=1 Tax=Nocardioides alcanivorans TaxID=2897352 RepID=UPI001F32E1B4|nr:hypothetical protein [Nocardioides alcanivorans]